LKPKRTTVEMTCIHDQPGLLAIVVLQKRWPLSPRHD
jgi:hypothetical protein